MKWEMPKRTSVPAPRARVIVVGGRPIQACLRHNVWARSRRQAAMGCIDDRDEAIELGQSAGEVCNAADTRPRGHEVTRPLGRALDFGSGDGGQGSMRGQDSGTGSNLQL